ncbi:MAG: hypothetical protein COA91_03865 [Robiginitomaculum sp.]|nr:MAG: hypothetical protein COA91_03865 [Robiginitomaculum sp.]
MTIIVRNLKTRPGGRESVRERIYETDVISIGRETGNDVDLVDLRVALHHAKLKFHTDGKIIFELLAGNSALINRRLITGASRKLKPGSHIRIGIYEIRIEEPTAPGTLTITLQQIETVDAAITSNDERVVFGLGRALPPKRLMAWVFALGVIGFFLALPLWAFKNPDSAQLKSLPIQADLSWNPGKISLMHANLKNDCKTCHVKAFVAVKDKTCAECHTGLKDHAKADQMQTSRPHPTGFGAKLDEISNMFGRPPARCASCHVEHNSKAKIINTSQKLCVDCHRDLNKNLKNTTLANVSDFGTDHPQFSPSVITKPSLTDPVLTRMSLDDNPQGFSGLKFPHDLHMDTGKSVAKMAQDLGQRYGFSDGVDCADCHRPEAGGAMFEPVSMQQDCAMCHDIAFEDDAAFEGGDRYLRTLRHGEPQEVIATMRDFYLAKALANIRDAEMNTSTRRRPGSAARIRDLNRRELAFKQADNRTATKVKAIFSKGGACFDCHVIDFPVDPASLDYRVRPISVNDRFYPKSPFEHTSHAVGDLNCESCHEAEKSKLSSDILLPKIELCRDCHIGEESYAKGGKFAQGTMPTTCLTCHTYHGGPHAELMGRSDGQ